MGVGRKNKSKGAYYERKTAELFNGIPGWSAKRQLASGAFGRHDPSLDGDVIAESTVLHSDAETGATVRHVESYKIEVKTRDGDFPKWIEKACKQGDIVALWKCGESVAPGYLLIPVDVAKKLLSHP